MRPRKEPIPFCLMAESSLGYYSRPSPKVAAIIKRDFKLIRRFIASETLPEPGLFDRQDAFFLPFADLRGVDRPGPNLFLYENLRTGATAEARPPEPSPFPEGGTAAEPMQVDDRQ